MSSRCRLLPPNMRHPAGFVLWGWAMLLVVLLSAAPTGAQVRTRLLGSAFDPASVSVVLSPKRLRLDAATTSPSPDRRKPGESLESLSPAGGVIRPMLPEVLPSGPGTISRTESAARPVPSTRAHAPRAPPLG